MSVTSRYRRTTTVALGALALTTATAGIATASTAQRPARSQVQAGADTTWCTIPEGEVVVGGRVIAYTPQIGPIPCGP